MACVFGVCVFTQNRKDVNTLFDFVPSELGIMLLYLDENRWLFKHDFSKVFHRFRWFEAEEWKDLSKGDTFIITRQL